MRQFWLVCAGILAFPAASAHAQDNCLPLDLPVSLSGFVVEGRFPGPPEFTSVQRGHAKFLAQFLYMVEPLCFAQDDAGVTHTHLVQMVQLACADTPLVHGERLTLRGTLYAAHTGYHRSPILLACQ